ncbi:keratin, type II cytoskeletal 2 epidermal-like [Ostrinia furnacalis]|uniref:keratin, type II cytoskeletal 2 epidermal-like n=1 Tax=Ostrinia furnacalis TaxID=93504 RepID=UPI00103B6EAE|nr:keratin, type II cytoskeletal 2 epidermal-like [Ostrinia furnacalis]
MRTMFIVACVCLAGLVGSVAPAPAEGFVFPDERREKKLEPIITPPVLPVLEHLERDPSTLLPSEKVQSRSRPQAKPRFNGGGFNVRPSGNGGLTASVSSSGSFGGASQSASQSFSFGFNEGFSASQAASQAASFNGFGGFSGSQASSQAASFGGSSVSGTASSAAAFGGGGFGGNSGSQSASSAFGFNSLNGFPQADLTFGDGAFDVRHRGVPDFPTFPSGFPNFSGRKGAGAAIFKSRKGPSFRSGDDFVSVVVSD